jgi:hypothetical protein
MLKRLLLIVCVYISFLASIYAQEGKAFYEGGNIHGVYFIFTNPLADSIAQKNLHTEVQRKFPVYPRSALRTILLDAYTVKVRQMAEIEDASYELRPAQSGDIDVILTIQLAERAKAKSEKGGILAGGKDFPILYTDNKSLFTSKLNVSGMLYSNNDAWYGRDDEMLKGNPLADNPAGKGFTGWAEGWVSGGLYGITTLSARQSMYLYGGASYILSGSAGREIFTDQSRAYGGFEDAYLGFLGTKTYKNGDRLTYNISAGRQQFSIGKGFIIRNTASNGDERAALQLNPRWSADFLGLFSLKYNNLLLQVFQLDPDELPVVDSKTIIRGINAEWGDKTADLLGVSVLYVPKSGSSYYTPGGEVLSREGLWLYNLRFYRDNPPGIPGLLLRSEIAYERNSNFDMGAFSGYAEFGWDFARSKGSPVLTYRFAYFSGDDPSTSKYERWDPLLTGGNGEEWVLGANHFKIVQNSNLIVNKLQASYRVTKKFQLVPQLLYMVAAQNNNIGGNPALSYMPKKEFGYEANVSWKFFLSRRWYFHGHFAYTVPGAGVKEALTDTRPWFSAMAFFRYSIF